MAYQGNHNSRGNSGGSFQQRENKYPQSDTKEKEPFNVKWKKKEEGKNEVEVKITEKEISSWIKTGITDISIEFANEYGKSLYENKLTNSQIRIVFGELRRIQMIGYTDSKTDFLLLKPKMAYAAKRHKDKGTGVLSFYEFFSVCYIAVISSIEEGEQYFKNFMQLTEAVLAYHKFHGGKEN